MTNAIKKAGEAAAKKVVQSGTKVAAAAAAAAPSVKITEPRAVSKEEAPNVIPYKEPLKTSMAPWKGWVDRLMKDKLPEGSYSRINNFFHFMPGDEYDPMTQMHPPDLAIPYSKDGEKARFREVSPGSQGFVDIPKHELDDDPYDSAYFKRDTRRRYIDPEFPHPEIEEIKLAMQDPNDPEVQEAKKKLAAGPGSSPGNGGNFPTGPSDFDPSGLRAVMSVTHAATEAELDKHMPDHLPQPTWTSEEEELIQWYKDRDLPVPIGGNWNFISKSKRVARW